MEEGVIHAHDEKNLHTSNPIMNIERWSQAKGSVNVRHSLHTWKHSGVLVSDVQKIKNRHKVALIECELREAIRMIHSKEQAEQLEFNYIYLRPPTVEDLANCLIRNYSTRETTISIRQKQGHMIQDMAAVQGLTWINKVFVAHNV